MEKIKKHLEQAGQKLHLEWHEKKKMINDDNDRTKKEIMEVANIAGFSPFAIIDFENDSIDDAKETQNLPELLRIGKMSSSAIDGESLDLPMLLPFTDKAVAFILDENNKFEVHTIFELIAIRFMLSLPQNLSKFYFVDNNLGRDFALMNKIDNKIVSYSIIANQQDRNKLFSDLENHVSDAFKKYLATFSSMKEYNTTANEMQEPYHFVFITNFPAGFTTETAEKLNTLINNGNAAKAGVYLFLSIAKNEKPPFGVEIDRFTESMTCIYFK